MSYKANLNEDMKAKWESLKRDVSVNREEKIFPTPTNMGNCSVNLSLIAGKLCLEIVPNETSDFDNEVEGVIVDIDENSCHVDSIMKIVENALQVEKAKKNGNPVKTFR